MNEVFPFLRDDSPAPAGETIGDILARPGFRLERIVSRGEPSPPDFWYDQQEDEWVLLCQGSAMLRYDNGTQLDLIGGDSLLIPAGRRHRVERVSNDAVWLALHFPPKA
jgi:cupin 2 domain-containing protein